MSESQDSIIQHHMQQQVQQRQILAMMGIGQWVRPESPTIAIASVAQMPVIEQQPVIDADDKRDSFYSASTISDNLIDDNKENHHEPDEIQPVIDTTANHYNDSSFSTAGSNIELESVDNKSNPDIEDLAQENVKTPDNEALTNDRNKTHSSHLDKVAPFDLQGGRYGNWVLLVDIQALNNDSQTLWQNIVQALSMECESASFPICSGMDTAELANASFAGYIFKVGRSEEVQIAALTPLPQGIEHPHLVSSLTLDEIINDPMLKRQLWEQIST